MRFKLVAVMAAAGSIGLAAVGCSASSAPGAGSAASHARAKHSAARSLRTSRSARVAGVRRADADRGVAGAPVPVAVNRPFGTGCNQLPRTGVGTRRGLAKLPVVTAMAQAPALSQLVHAIRLAGLTGTLDRAHALTIFAPDNGAFAVFGTSNLQALFSTRSDLVRVLTFQMVAARVRPAELARQRVLTTVGGTKIYPSKAPPSYYVNNALVTCGNLRTANATVYVVNRLVVPGT